MLRIYDLSYKTYIRNTQNGAVMNSICDVNKSKRETTRSISLLLMLLICLLFSLNSYAHKVNMFAYGEGEQVFLEGYYADGKKAQNSAVLVVDSEGKQVAQGVTSSEGQYSFIYPKGTDLLITLDAGMGHKTEYRITESELNDEEVDDEEVDDEKPTSNVETVLAIDESTTDTPGFALNENHIRMEVERAVGKAIKPLMREVSEMREEKSFAEIIGGIGFIFGILGAFMYYKARKIEQK